MTEAYQFRDDFIFDIGMHRGEDTEFYLKKGYRVIAFEADPGLIAFCKEKFSSEIQKGLLTIVEGAIAPEGQGETIKFYASSNSVWGTIDDDWADRNKKLGATAEQISIAWVDIRKVFEKYGVPFFVKIDIEGMDLFVLRVISSLPVKPKYLSIESEKVSFDKLVSEIDLLQKSGYGSFKIVQQKDIPGRRIETLDLKGNIFEHVFQVHSSGSFGEDVPTRWIGHDEAVVEYKKIFDDYARFGDQAKINMHESQAPTILSDPGWYDTHAKLLDPQCDVSPVATVIMTCKNRLAHLKLSLPKLASQADIDMVVVDYGCGESSGEWIRSHFPNVSVVSVTDDPVFSLSRARNIGALHAKTDCLVFLDADTIVDFNIGAWVRTNVRSNEYLIVDPKYDASLSGILIVSRQDFFEVGKYDEAFRGWGWEDIEIHARLDKSGVKRLLMSASHLSSVPHDDSMRHFSVSDGGSSSKDRALVSGFLYSKLKTDMESQGLMNVDLEGRSRILNEIRKFTELLFESNESVMPFEVNLNPNRDFLESLKITYSVKKSLQ